MKTTQSNIKPILCLLLFLVTCGSAKAEKWEWVHRNFRLDYFVDLDSIKKDGDKATGRVLQSSVCEIPLNNNYQKLTSIFTYTVEHNCLDGSRKILSAVGKNRKREIIFEDNKAQLDFQSIPNGGVAAQAGKICANAYSSPVDDLKKYNLMPFSNSCIGVASSSERIGEQSRTVSETYLDLTRLSASSNGLVSGWVRRVHEKPLKSPNKSIDFYAREDKFNINCTTRELAISETFFFDIENKQIDSWKYPSSSPFNFQSVRPGTAVDNILEQACNNVGKQTPFSIAPSSPNNRNNLPTISSTGTAFAVSKKEFITNAHVVEGCTALKLGGVTATVKAIDSKSDLALLNTSNYGEIAKLRAGRLRQGDAVTVVGYPLNGILASGAQVTTGNVSALAGMGNDSRFIQISAPVQPGNSGGPLVDSSGNVVGVVVSKLNAMKMASITGDIPQNVNFAISPFVLQAFLEANGVDYLSVPSTKNLTTADIADVAKKYTSLVECFK